jgi:hypothetical protein
MSSLNAIQEFITANSNKKLDSVKSELLHLIQELVSQQSNRAVTDAWRGSSDNGTLECFCYYHKTWEKVTTETYGSKQGSKHGFNNMCKVGTNAWTKWNKVRKQVDERILSDVMKGMIKQDEIAIKKETMLAAVDAELWPCKNN